MGTTGIPDCACLTLCIDNEWDGEFSGSLYYTRPGGPMEDSRRVERHDTRCPVAERSRIRREMLDAIESLTDIVQLSEGPAEPEFPVEMCHKESLIETLDRICPEK